VRPTAGANRCHSGPMTNHRPLRLFVTIAVTNHIRHRSRHVSGNERGKGICHCGTGPVTNQVTNSRVTKGKRRAVKRRTRRNPSFLRLPAGLVECALLDLNQRPPQCQCDLGRPPPSAPVRIAWETSPARLRPSAGVRAIGCTLVVRNAPRRLCTQPVCRMLGAGHGSRAEMHMSEGEQPAGGEPQSTGGWWLRIFVAVVVVVGGIVGIIWYANRQP